MEQAPSSNQNPGFWQKNQKYLVLAIGAFAVVGIIYFAQKPKPNENETSQNQNQEQIGGENTNNDKNANQNSTQKGNVTVQGTLRVSDLPSRGNLMVERSIGKIYVLTKRDFSQWLGMQVTLDAQGTMGSFVFLGFRDASGQVVPPRAGAESQVAAVHASGKLENSDNATLGNYIISSDAGKIYLQSVHDYSAWVGSEVDLAAVGSMQSFTQAQLTKK